MSAASALRVKFESPRAVAPEDRSRADFYALLARLFYGAADDRLLQAIVISPEPAAQDENSRLLESWRALAAAAGVMNHEAVHDEYERLFIGVGRPEVMLFGSYYLAGFMNERPLAQLRDDLAKLGLTRQAAATEPEDHIAALCDVMRFLIMGDVEAPPAGRERERVFFATHLQPWIVKFCQATMQSPQANFYRRVASLAQAFFEIEMQAFEME
jgi:TorA maturation chaperone TorD